MNTQFRHFLPPLPRCASISAIAWMAIFSTTRAQQPSATNAPAANSAAAHDTSWPNYGNDPHGQRYSPLAQVNRDNVAQLKVAWTYRTGVLEQLGDLKKSATFEATPILVDGRLYLSTALDHVIALEPDTGKKIWEYDPRVATSHRYSEVTSRGVSAWKDSGAKAGVSCALRIFIGTIDARLIALDGVSGKPCADFGVHGQVDLTKDVNLRDAGDYQVTSAPAIAKDVVITGSSIGDNRAVELERGIVRGFDARSGKQRWSWDPIPWAAKTTPRTGAGNAWSTLSVDAERDLVFIPTGSASPDYFGGMRLGDDKWANSVVALKASTGEFIWGFPGRAPRFVGLRRSFAADFVFVARWDAGGGDHHEDGARVCAEPADGRAAAAGGRTAGAEERYSRRRGLADAAGFHDIDGAGEAES